MTTPKPIEIDSPITRLRGRAPERSKDVTRLRSFAETSICPTAGVAFAAGVDTDRFLAGTDMSMPYGQAPQAIRRGAQFEARLKADDYQLLIQALRPAVALPETDLRIVNLRTGVQRNRRGLIERFDRTRELLGRIAAAGDDSPNLIDGAVFCEQIGGRECFFETDALAVGSGGALSVAEIKSFPLVDGRADEEKVAAALDQAALYVMLASRTVEDLGLPADRVLRNVHLILPRNVGLQPVLVQRDVTAREQRARELVRRAPTINDVLPLLPPGSSFDPDPEGPQVQWAELDGGTRITALETIIEAVGTQYRPGACLSHCGFARVCRLQATAAGDVELLGGPALRYIPGVESLDRAAQLVDGARPLDVEAPAAEVLSRAGVLIDGAMDEETP